MFLRSFQQSFSRSAHFSQCYRSAVPCLSVTYLAHVYIFVHSSATQIAAETVVISSVTARIVTRFCWVPQHLAQMSWLFQKSQLYNFQFKICPTGKKLTCTCILCYAVRIRLLKRADAMAFHLCCFYFTVVLIVDVPFPFGARAGYGIRLYRFLIITFLSTFKTISYAKKNERQTQSTVKTLNLLYSQYTLTQLLIAIIDAR